MPDDKNGPVIASRGRILLVDDEPLLLRGFAKVLGGVGYEVVTAHDGTAAAELLTSGSFDAIVSDIGMPGLSGIGLLRAAREHDLDVPVVLVTGAPAIETAVQALEYGAFQYLKKPVDPATFVTVVDKAVRLHRIARMKREALDLLGKSALGAGDRAGLEASFDRALDSLWIAYQPIVRAADRSLFGYEALLRTDEAALPHPGAVLDAAERLGRVEELGRAIRATASSHVSSAPTNGMLFVNLHTRDLADDTLVSHASPLSRIADRVVLEVTERASLEEVPDARARVALLREMGYRIAVDDLGAGYAGLASFALLEPEFVKLDMSLIRDVHENATKQKLVRSITSLCADMGMMVVGEGVERIEERDALVDLGVDLLQGFLLARPSPSFASFTW